MVFFACRPEQPRNLLQNVFQPVNRSGRSPIPGDLEHLHAPEEKEQLFEGRLLGGFTHLSRDRFVSLPEGAFLTRNSVRL